MLWSNNNKIQTRKCLTMKETWKLIVENISKLCLNHSCLLWSEARYDAPCYTSYWSCLNSTATNLIASSLSTTCNHELRSGQWFCVFGFNLVRDNQTWSGRFLDAWENYFTLWIFTRLRLHEKSSSHAAASNEHEHTYERSSRMNFRQTARLVWEFKSTDKKLKFPHRITRQRLVCSFWRKRRWKNESH